MKAKIYSTVVCSWCDLAKEFLQSHNVEIEVIDVGQDEKAAQEMIEKSGQMGVPVIEINNEIIVGFDKNRLSKIIESEK